jgi:hypothetical protein
VGKILKGITLKETIESCVACKTVEPVTFANRNELLNLEHRSGHLYMRTALFQRIQIGFIRITQQQLHFTSFDMNLEILHNNI